MATGHTSKLNFFNQPLKIAYFYLGSNSVYRWTYVGLGRDLIHSADSKKRNKSPSKRIKCPTTTELRINVLTTTTRPLVLLLSSLLWSFWGTKWTFCWCSRSRIWIWIFKEKMLFLTFKIRKSLNFMCHTIYRLRRIIRHSWMVRNLIKFIPKSSTPLK